MINIKRFILDLITSLTGRDIIVISIVYTLFDYVLNTFLYFKLIIAQNKNIEIKHLYY